MAYGHSQTWLAWRWYGVTCPMCTSQPLPTTRTYPPRPPPTLSRYFAPSDTCTSRGAADKPSLMWLWERSNSVRLSQEHNACRSSQERYWERHA